MGALRGAACVSRFWNGGALGGVIGCADGCATGCALVGVGSFLLPLPILNISLHSFPFIKPEKIIVVRRRNGRRLRL
jgi:hypothetical protein